MDNWSLLNVIETIITFDRSNYIRKLEENYNANPACPLVLLMASYFERALSKIVFEDYKIPSLKAMPTINAHDVLTVQDVLSNRQTRKKPVKKWFSKMGDTQNYNLDTESANADDLDTIDDNDDKMVVFN